MYALLAYHWAAVAIGLANPQDAGDAKPVPTLMIVELPAGARYVGQPKRCPGETEDPEVANTLCIAELYQGRIHVIRHIAGPRVRASLPMRFTSHALRTRRPLEMLAYTVPFEDQGTVGNFAAWWLRPEEDGAYCLDTDTIARMEPSPVRTAFEKGFRRSYREPRLDRTTYSRCIRS